MDSDNRKPLYFIGCEKDYKGLPPDVQTDAGHNLDRVQQGKSPEISFDSLHGLGSGIRELRIDENTDTFRIVYVAKLSEAVFVLDAFKKKSPTGNRLPKNVKQRIEQRYKVAEEVNDDLRGN